MTCLRATAVTIAAFMIACTQEEGPPAMEPAPLSIEAESALWEAIDAKLEFGGIVSDRPAQGFVPDEKTAVQIAEAVSRALYGEDQTTRESPFSARLREGVWTVVGTLRPAGAYGGTALLQISQDDGRILLAVHEGLGPIGDQ